MSYHTLEIRHYHYYPEFVTTDIELSSPVIILLATYVLLNLFLMASYFKCILNCQKIPV